MQGRSISAQQYLENALRDEVLLIKKKIFFLKSTSSKTTDQSRRIRKSLFNFFPDRDCFTMIRPVIDENELKSLSKLPTNRLRPEFVKQIS